jgi:surfeit locus 1 family protein
MIRFRPFWGLTIWALLGVAMLVALGVWQLHRLEWKTALIADAGARSKAAPIPLADVLQKAPADAEYTHVVVRGEYGDKEGFLYTVLSAERVGYEVIAPFRMTDGRTILVDEGFVPQQGEGPGVRVPPPMGEVEVTGLVRETKDRGLFVPKPDLVHRIWYGRDPKAMATFLGAPDALPVIVARDAGPPGELPEGGHTRLTFRNEHFSYAMTWFGLAATLVFIYFAFHWSKGRFKLG